MSQQWSPESLVSGAPGLYESLVVARDDSTAVFASLTEFVMCMVWWDTLALMDEYGLNTETPHEDQVVCRECGEWAEEIDEPHVRLHDMNLAEYRRAFPAAPLTPGERAHLPSVRIAW